MASPPSGSAPPPDEGVRVRRFDAVAVGVIAVIFLTEAAIGILLIAVNAQYPQAKLGAGVSLTGWALSFYFGSKVVGQPLSGWLADRTDPRRVLIAGCALTVPAIVLMGRLHSQVAYIALWTVFGLALAVVWPSMYAIVGRRFRPSLQGRLFAIISIGQIAGTAVGAGIGGALIDYWSYTAAFIAAIASMVAAIVLAALVIPASASARAAEPATAGVLGGLRTVGRLISGPILLLAVLIAVMSFGVSMLTPDLKPYGARVLGLKYSSFLALLLLPGAAAGALLVPAGYVADRFGRSLPMIVGLSVFSLSLALITLTRSPIVAMLIATVAAIGYVLCLPAISATMLDLTTIQTRGAVTGFTTSVQAIGGVVGPPVGGALVDSLGPLAPFRGAASLMALALVLCLVYTTVTRGLYDRREHQAESKPVV